MVFALDSPEWSLLQATADRLIDRETRLGLGSLTADERTFFLVWIAESEVANGGMHAVCYNSTGNYIRLFPVAFRAIGAPTKAAAFERLAEVFGAAGPAIDHETRAEQHESLSEAKATSIGRLDRTYDTAERIDEALYVLAKKIHPQNP